MAITAQDVAAFLTANPGLSDAQIASLANQYGVSSSMLSEATGVPVAQIEQRASTAGAPLTGGMLAPAAPAAPAGFSDVQIAQRAQQILSTGGTTFDVAREAFNAGVSADTIARALNIPVAEVNRLSGGLLSGGGSTIPPRPTFDSVFSQWNEDHKARFGTYVNLATSPKEGVTKQIEELNKTLASEQKIWDTQYGNTEAGKKLKENPPPTWADVYNTWSEQYQKTFNQPYLDRPWNADVRAAEQKRELDTAYLAALSDYNKKNGTNVAPDPSVLGTSVQPNAFFKIPEAKKWYQSPEGVIKAVAPFALLATGVGSALGAALAPGISAAAQVSLGNALVSGLTTGAITGDVEKGLIAGALAGGGTYLTQSGMLGDVFDSIGLGEYKDVLGIPSGTPTTGTPATTPTTTVPATGAAPSVPSAFDQAVNTAVTGGQQPGMFGQVGTGGFGTALPSVSDLTTSLISSGFSPGTAANIAGATLAGIGAAGLGTAATGLLGGAAGGAATGAAGGAAAGAGAGTASSILSNLPSGLTSTLQGLLGNQNVTNLIGTGIDLARLQAVTNAANAQGRQLAQEAAAIGAAAQTPFTPYTLTTGTGTATISPGAATTTAAAPYEALRGEALSQAQETLGAINPAQATQQFYQNLEALAGPTRQREQEALLGRLSARGLLGIGRNLPTAGGGVAGVNPFMESLLSAQEQGRLQQALTAQQFGTSEAARQQALAQNLQTQAMGIDQQTMRQLEAARLLGADERSLAERNAAIRARAGLAGLELRAPYEQLGLIGQIGGINAVAGAGRGLFGLPTQPGGTSSTNLVSEALKYLSNAGMSQSQANNFLSNITSGLDTSGNSQATQNLVNELQRYGIF